MKSAKVGPRQVPIKTPFTSTYGSPLGSRKRFLVGHIYSRARRVSRGIFSGGIVLWFYTIIKLMCMV